MPNYKYEEFKLQVYKKFTEGKSVQEITNEYNLTNKPKPEQNLPTRNIVYTWYKNYLLQNEENSQSESNLQFVNMQEQNLDANKIVTKASPSDNEIETLQSVKTEDGRETSRNNEENNDGLIIGGITLGGLILLLLML